MAASYNQICEKIEDLIAFSYPSQNFRVSSNLLINPTSLEPNEKYLQFPLQ
jgi:hypothetical protein